MAVTIGSYTFEGPYENTGPLQDRSGVYAIICGGNMNQYHLIDVGESAFIRSRVESHERRICWKSSCSSSLAVAVYYTPHLGQPGRMAIEQELRRSYWPPCGER